MRYSGHWGEVSPGDQKRLRAWYDALKTKEEKIVALERLSWGQFLECCIANGELHRDLVQGLMRDQDRDIAIRAANMAWPKSYCSQCKPEIDKLLSNASASEALVLCSLLRSRG